MEECLNFSILLYLNHQVSRDIIHWRNLQYYSLQSWEPIDKSLTLLTNKYNIQKYTNIINKIQPSLVAALVKNIFSLYSMDDSIYTANP